MNITNFEYLNQLNTSEKRMLDVKEIQAAVLAILRLQVLPLQRWSYPKAQNQLGAFKKNWYSKELLNTHTFYTLLILHGVWKLKKQGYLL